LYTCKRDPLPQVTDLGDGWVLDARFGLGAAGAGQYGACGSEAQHLEEITTIQLVTRDIPGEFVGFAIHCFGS
jgi:hypothetical protein